MQFEPASEDTVQCCFFITSSHEHNSDLKLWEQLCENLNNTIVTLSKDYIWHRDEFKVYLPIFENKSNYIPSHIASTTNVGDNIEDEWFIVYLVLELTKLYEDLIVQIKDNDGDFLLIEAADYLPSWIKPENTDNRVFIYKNHIHIIPPNLVSMKSQLDLKQAVEIVIKSNTQTQVSQEIEQAIISRIGNYPEKIKENFHTAIVKLPLHIASVLNLNPALIAPLVCSYFNHDAIDEKACKDLTFENWVNVEVKFTKFLYAMLMHAKPIKNIKHNITTEKDKSLSIGFKLACGFLMIMNSTSDIYASKEFNKFLKTLKGNGYFKNNIEGSKQYQELLKKAKEYFAGIECPVSLHFLHKVSELMSSKMYEQEIEIIKMKNMAPQNLREDDDDWLNIQDEQLNDLLQTRYGKKLMFKNQDEITPCSITTQLTEFIKKTSDLEGIETYEDVQSENETIEFDAEEFNNCLEKFMNFLSCKDNDLDLDSDLSEDEEDIPLTEHEDKEIDRELQLKLNCDPQEELHNSNAISFNIVQSMKEEQASSGPSSNLLKAVGFNKIDVLGSSDVD